MATQRLNGLLATGLALAVMATVAPGASGQSVDPRLLPWLGCWEPAATESVGDLLCVRPSAQSQALEVVRLAGNEIVSRELVWADGARHETVRESCEGWEQGSFSQDGRRLFLSSEHVCEAGVGQEGAGIMAFASLPDEWLDIRVVSLQGERTAWVQYYVLASAETTEAAGFGDVLERAWSAGQARIAASAALDVDDVIEATHIVPSEAVEALLAESGSRLDLSADELIRMADAGVPESTIDVAVAVSYPETFRVAAGTDAERKASALDDGSLRRRWAYGGFMGPAFYDPFYRYGYGYNSYGYGYGYGGYYGYPYSGGYGYRPTVVVVDRQQPEQHGRVVNGRGYTRGRGSSVEPSRGYVPSGGRPAAAPSRGGSSSSGTATKGTSTGRTAKPRGGRDDGR